MTTMNNTPVQRLITSHDLLVAKRLKAIYTRKKQALNLTQEKMEALTGYKQATISCHMNGHIALRGVRGITAYADALEVSPQEIDPRFEARFLKQEDREIVVPVTTLTGKTVLIQPRILNQTSTALSGFLLGDEYAPLFAPDTVVITDKDTPLAADKMAAMEIQGRVALVRIHAFTRRSVTYSLPWGFDACRERAIRTKSESREALDVYYPTTPVKVLLSDISFLAPVVAIELP